MIKLNELTQVAKDEGRKFYDVVVAMGCEKAVRAGDLHTVIARAVKLCGKPETPAEVAEYLAAHPALAGAYEAMFKLGFETARLGRA